MNIDYSIFRDRKVFLTGHTGFKGTWMLKVLNYFGAIVKGYSLEPNNNLYRIINGDSLCDSVIGDIRDRHKIREAIDSFSPDFIFHFAAQPLVRFSYDMPDYTFDVNVMGTLSLLEAIRLINKQCVVIIITTDKVYENKEWQFPYRENDRLGGFDPYSSSKACAEMIVNCYRQSYFSKEKVEVNGIKIASARAGNVIGGGDWAKDRIIPDIINALSNKRNIYIRNPNSVRPWQHVLEPLSGYLQLAALMSQNSDELYSDSWNFGPYLEDNLTVHELAEKAIKIWGNGNISTSEYKDNLHEANLLKLDISKSMSLLGWKPKWNADRAIEETINWYKEFTINNNNLLDNQIKAYFKK